MNCFSCLSRSPVCQLLLASTPLFVSFFKNNSSILIMNSEGSPNRSVSFHSCQFTGQESRRVKAWIWVWSVKTQLDDPLFLRPGSICATPPEEESHQISVCPQLQSHQRHVQHLKSMFDIHYELAKTGTDTRSLPGSRGTFSEWAFTQQGKETWLESTACKLDPSFDTVYLYEWKVHVVSVCIRNLCTLFTST